MMAGISAGSRAFPCQISSEATAWATSMYRPLQVLAPAFRASARNRVSPGL